MVLGRHRVRFVHATPRARSQGGWWPDTLPSEGEPARDGDRRSAGRGRPVAELAGIIVAPAIRGPARRDGAGVVIARVECREREPARDRDRSEVVGEREPVNAPAIGGPTSRYAARETAARAYGGEREPARDRDWGGAARLVRAYLRSSVRAIAELAVIIVAPTV